MAEAASVRLIAHTDIPTVELTVLDSSFQFVRRSVGSLDTTLPPGNYLLQYKAGSRVTEVPVMLRAGSEPVTVPPPQLSTRSPAPLAGGDAADRYGAFARDLSLEMHEHHGEGGELFIFIRTSTKDLQKGLTPDALFDARLLDAERNQIVSLRNSGRRSPDETAVGCNIALTPGTYLIRYAIGGTDELEQTIVVSAGWQTQIFSSSRPYGFEARHYGPNFPEAAVLMVPRGQGFDPHDRSAVIAESARLALAGSCAVGPEERLRSVTQEVNQIRSSVPQQQLSELLREKFRNPMLGIYGVHLMLLNPERHWDLIKDTVDTLESLLGSHPDVLALTSLEQLRHLGEHAVFDLPPMLRNSWALLVGNSSDRPDVVPAGAYSAAIANRVWGSDGWLVWRPPPVRRAEPLRAPPGATVSATPAVAPAPAPAMTVTEAIDRIHRYVVDEYRAKGAGVFAHSEAREDLDDTERAILSYAIGVLRLDRSGRDLAWPTMTWVAKAWMQVQSQLERYSWADRFTGGVIIDPLIREMFTPGRLVRSLGVPAAALNAALVALASKLTGATAPADQPVTRSPVNG
jgi:hypothetical protein